ncbi:MAG TPA: nucleoside transporter C-terminal domain-containing protein [Thermodesulfovibrionales bacterium]|nr:nucleoside transporter C-terminal domain-containing protein [Thermodesulfovibrionales bacterium]
MTYNLVSFVGIFVLMLVAWVFSENRRVVNWRVILWGTALELLFGVFIFVVPAGSQLFLVVNDAVVRLLDSASAGTRFVFGRLALPPGAKNEAGEESIGFILAFQALPTIIFFSSLMAALYYAGLMPRLIKLFSKAFTKLMRISGAESLSVSSNIFVGVEANMTVLPYLNGMTRSEFCTVLAAGMSTTASNVLALYVFLLQGSFPTIAGHLVSSSILSAVGAIVMSKIILPESDKPATLSMEVEPHYNKESSVMEAVINGANEGAKMLIGIVALLLAFLGLVALVDYLLSGVGIRLNDIMGINMDWSLKGLLGYLFYPLTLAIGVPVSDAYEISKLIGERAVLTEVKAYQDLAALLSAGTLKDPRSAVLAAYALNGFAHFASLAIFVGGMVALVPKRTKDISGVGLRALIAATLATLMTAAVAGTFFTQGSILLGK